LVDSLPFKLVRLANLSSGEGAGQQHAAAEAKRHGDNHGSYAREK
jgi:hypothetical protein